MQSERPNKFTKKERIKKKIDFKNIFNNGEIIKGSFYYCRYLGNDLSSSRIGVVVKKEIGNSIVRNYEKRIIREFFRTNKHRLQRNYDIVFSLLQRDGSFLEKKEEFEKIISKIQ